MRSIRELSRRAWNKPKQLANAEHQLAQAEANQVKDHLFFGNREEHFNYVQENPDAVLMVTALQDRKRLAYLRYQGGVDTMLNALNADEDLFMIQLNPDSAVGYKTFPSPKN